MAVVPSRFWRWLVAQAGATHRFRPLTARLGSMPDRTHALLSAVCLAVALVLTLLATRLPLRLGTRHLESMEL